MRISLYQSYSDSSGLAGYSLSLRLRRIQLPQRGSLLALSLRDISPKGRDKFMDWEWLPSADCFRLR